jgi:hypothetical protein
MRTNKNQTTQYYCEIVIELLCLLFFFFLINNYTCLISFEFEITFSIIFLKGGGVRLLIIKFMLRICLF